MQPRQEGRHCSGAARGDDVNRSSWPGEDHVAVVLPPRSPPRLPAAAQNEEAVADDEALPENGTQISKEHSEDPTATKTCLEMSKMQGSRNVPPALELPPALGVAPTRPPCYGWISDTETDSESVGGEMLSDKSEEVNSPCPGESLPSKAKRMSR
uniref:Uncharacterized protein n=1 Tax=Arundo donax TaxID=35708 RepID=A0A0A9BVA5_ARUDO